MIYTRHTGHAHPDIKSFFSWMVVTLTDFPPQRSTASSHRSRCRSARRVTCHLATMWSTSRCSPLRTNQRCSAVRTSSLTADLLPHSLLPLLSIPLPLTPPGSTHQASEKTASVWCGRVTPTLPPPQVNTSQSPHGVTPPPAEPLCC